MDKIKLSTPQDLPDYNPMTNSLIKQNYTYKDIINEYYSVSELESILIYRTKMYNKSYAYAWKILALPNTIIHYNYDEYKIKSNAFICDVKFNHNQYVLLTNTSLMMNNLLKIISDYRSSNFIEISKVYRAKDVNYNIDNLTEVVHQTLTQHKQKNIAKHVSDILSLVNIVGFAITIGMLLPTTSIDTLSQMILGGLILVTGVSAYLTAFRKVIYDLILYLNKNKFDCNEIMLEFNVKQDDNKLIGG